MATVDARPSASKRSDTGRSALIAHPGAAADDLAAALATEVVIRTPALVSTDPAWEWADPLQEWSLDLDGLDTDRIAVCTWPAPSAPFDLVDRDLDRWVRDVEVELAIWTLAIGAAVRSCRDGGSVVVVVERPAPIDASGRAAELTVAEGLVTFARSAALVHGERGVRVNVVTTALWTAPDHLLGMGAALHSFPGTVEREVAGAVRSLWSDDTCGITGTVVRADGGRSW